MVATPVAGAHPYFVPSHIATHAENAHLALAGLRADPVDHDISTSIRKGLLVL